MKFGSNVCIILSSNISSITVQNNKINKMLWSSIIKSFQSRQNHNQKKEDPSQSQNQHVEVHTYGDFIKPVKSTDKQFTDKQSIVEQHIDIGPKETICTNLNEKTDPHKILDSMIGQTITGKELIKILNGIPLLKFMNDSDQHFGMKYVTGCNHDVLPFVNSGECEKKILIKELISETFLNGHRRCGFILHTIIKN